MISTGPAKSNSRRLLTLGRIVNGGVELQGYLASVGIAMGSYLGSQYVNTRGVSNWSHETARLEPLSMRLSGIHRDPSTNRFRRG